MEKDSQIINGYAVLSYANKINLSIVASQINDYGFYYNTISLRNAYDVFLLSKKTNAKEAVNTLKTLSHPLNCFLATCYEIFNSADSLEYNNTKMVASYLSDFNNQFTNPIATKRKHKRIKIYLSIKSTLTFCFKCIFYKQHRNLLFSRLLDRSWRKEKLKQLGFKQ